MARMSIDDSFGRDPRVMRLATLCTWSRRETMGALFDVWAVCYDRVTPVLSVSDIDITAALNGFSENLIEANLGTKVARGVRISGARVRIEYLKGSEESGRAGGLKSGESRRKKAEEKRRDPSKGSEGSRNPSSSPSVPDPSSASPPVSASVALPARSFASLAPDSIQADRDRWCTERWNEVSDHRGRIARKFKLAGVRPLHPMDTGRRDLGVFVRDGGDRAFADVEHVIAVRVAEAESKRTVRWLSGGMFSGSQWTNALGMSPADASKTTSAPSRAQSALEAQLEHIAALEAAEETNHDED